MLPRTHVFYFQHEMLNSTSAYIFKIFTESPGFSKRLAFERLIRLVIEG